MTHATCGEDIEMESIVVLCTEEVVTRELVSSRVEIDLCLVIARKNINRKDKSNA